MKGLVPRVARDVAWQRLARGGAWRRLWNRLTRSASDAEPPSRDRKLPLLETVWLPTYRVSFTAEHAARTLNFDALVNAHSGHVVLGELSHAQWCEVDDFPAQADIAPERAGELARGAVVKNLLTRRGWGRHPQIVATQSPEMIGYPAWAYYFATRTGMLDAKLLDAMTGSMGGPQFKTSLLATLSARQTNRQTDA